MAWYYYLNGGNQGPVELAELQRLHERRVVLPETPVWTEGMADWIPFRSSTAVPVTVTASAATHPCVECGRVFPEDEMLSYEGSWVCAACKPLFFQKVKEGVVSSQTFTLAGVGARFAAVLVDGLIMLIFTLVPIFLLTGLSGLTHRGMSPGATALTLLFQYAAPALYEIIFIVKYGATPGKMLMKIKVIRADGGPLSYGLSTGRYFAKILSGLILYIGYLMAFWDDEKRALHDHICKTRVIVNPS